MTRILALAALAALSACASLTPEQRACYAEHGVNAALVDGDRIGQALAALTDCGIVTEAE